MSDENRSVGAGEDSFLDFLGGKDISVLDALDDENTEPRVSDAKETIPESSADDSLDSAVSEILGLSSDEDDSGVEGDGNNDAPTGESGESRGTEQPAIDLESLASTLGLGEDDLVLENGSLKLKTKVDGEESRVSLDELRKGYQLQKHFTKQNEAFLKQKQEWDQARQAQEKQLLAQAQMAAEILQNEEKQLAAEYTKDWSSLRQSDPAEYAAQVADYNRKLDEIKGRQQALVKDYAARQQAAQEQARAQHAEQLAKGRETLVEKLGWKGDEAFKAGAEKLRSYLVGQGIPEKEVDRVSDPMTLVIADKARKYDEIMAKVDLARKKISGKEAEHKVPKGKASPPKGGKQRRRQESISRLRKEKSVEAAADVFRQIGIAE